MTQQTESRILKKFNYQMWTFIIALITVTGGGLKVAHGWYSGVITAINQNKVDNTLIRYEIGVNNARVDKLELRQDRVEGMVYSGKFQK